MKKLVKKILKITLLACIAAILTVVTIVLSPGCLFANKMEYRQFTVYSNGEISNDVKVVLDNAMNLVKKSEIYDPDYKYNVILCYNSFYNKIDDRLFGAGPTARATFNNLIIKVQIDPKQNLAFATFHKACEVNLTEALAHEMIHCLQADKYGIMRFNPLNHPEFWKLEGYPEYISRQPQLSSKNYSLTSDIDRYVKLRSETKDIWISVEEGGCEVPDYYYKGRLMIQYLMDIKHFSYYKILNDTVSENTVYRQMIKWKDSTEALKNSQAF